MIKSRLFNWKVFLIVLIILFIPLSIAILGNFTNYEVWSKPDSGSAGTNASSTNFIQRFVSGNNPVSQYSSDSYSGRLGVLENYVKKELILSLLEQTI